MGRWKRLFAGVCWVALLCNSLLSAELPAPLAAQFPTEASDVTQRIEQLQQRLDRLEAENGQLRQSMLQSQGGLSQRVTPANAEMWNADTACPPACQCPVCAAAKDGKGDWKTGWNNGIEWVSPDKAFKVHIGGRTQLDFVGLNAESGALAGAGGGSGFPAGVGTGSPNHDDDAVVFRRARLRADGTIFETIEYVVEYDFVNSLRVDAPTSTANTANIPAPTDAYWTFKEIPWFGNFRVGLQKEAIGFEHLTSSRFLNFMERSYLQDLFTGPNNNGFSPGVSLFNNYDGDRGLWAIGMFKNTNTSNPFAFGLGNGTYSMTGRLTYLLIDDKECNQLLHVGASGSMRDPDGNLIRFRTRSLRNGPGNLATVYGDTGTFNADKQYLAGIELVGVSGSWNFQSEWIRSWSTDTSNFTPPAGFPGGGTNAAGAAGTPHGTYMSQGGYCEVQYFLTGEVREYDRKAAAFGRVTPKRNARWKGGCYEPGAWQAGFRYGFADLNDNGIKGGYLNEYTVGLNWFLNPNMKIQWNYVLTQRNFDKVIAPEAGARVNDGLIHGFGMRLAHDF